MCHVTFSKLPPGYKTLPGDISTVINAGCSHRRAAQPWTCAGIYKLPIRLVKPVRSSRHSSTAYRYQEQSFACSTQGTGE